MPIPIGALIAMQAAGMVVDYLGTKDQIEMGKRGAQIENEQLERELSMTRLQAEDASLEAMKKLRENLGAQAVYMAARGTRGSAGSALTFRQESISNFNADERMRKINQMSREAAYRTQKTINELHQNAYEKKAWNSFVSRSINRIPTSPEAWTKIGEGFGLNKA